MDQDASDIGRAWEDALDKYCTDTGTNIKYLPQMKWDVSAIMSEQERQVDTFNKYRHNKGTTDKLRSMISRNSVVIQSLANNVANAASTAFPPSAAILTAFTYVMKASKNVSDDYDQVSAFFEIMGSLMERLSLLESKMPTAKNYKIILMRVFSSLMGLCGTATKYVTSGRFKHWLKALYRGTDDDIKADYTKLETNIQRLESATMFATLATVMETKTDVKELTAISMQTLKVGNQTLAVSTQSLGVSLDTQAMVGGVTAKQEETLTVLRRFERRMTQKDESKDDGPKKPKDAGAKRNAALNLVKTTFSTTAEPAVQLKEVQASYVQGTFTWVFEEEGFKTFIDGESPLLWVSGPPGIGKSCVAHLMVGKLLNYTANDTRHSVAYYFFREEDDELRSARSMLKATVVQTAIGDGRYRDEVIHELKTGGEDIGEKAEDIWTRFIADKYPKDAEQKLYIVLDGLDEADEEDQKQVLELLKRIKEQQLSIQIAFTSRATKEIEESIADLQPSKVELTKQKISTRGGDLWKIIMKRGKTLSKLKRLQKPALRKIGLKLRQKADSVLYVEHMLRRLNVLGREKLILKELEKLPDDLPKLYELLLHECQKDRGTEQLVALKKLFAWLAYSKRPLTLGEATSLLNVIPDARSLSLEEEIDGRSSRILDIVTATTEADIESGSDESDSDLTEKNEEPEPDDFDILAYSPLKFQERSMRQYFRAMEVDENGLRSSPSLGHYTIFDMIGKILNAPAMSHYHIVEDKDIIWQLRMYAAECWILHFSDIKLEDLSDNEMRNVIGILRTLFVPEGQPFRTMVNFARGSETTIFGDDHQYRVKFFEHLKVWVDRAKESLKQNPEFLNAEDTHWINECSSEGTILDNVAKGYALSLFRTEETWLARTYLEGTKIALRMTTCSHDLSKGVFEDDHLESDIKIISEAFPELSKTSQAMRSIAMALCDVNLYTQALEQAEKAVQAANSDIDFFQCYLWIGEISLNQSNKIDDEDEKQVMVKKAYEAINTSMTIYKSTDALKGLCDPHRAKESMQFNITNRARCELKLGEIDKAIITMDEAYKTNADDDLHNSLNSGLVEELFAELEKRKDYEKIISVVGQLSKWDRQSWLGFRHSTGHECFQRAAWKCNKQDFMIETYESLIAEVDLYGAGGPLRNKLVTIYMYSLSNYTEAKRLVFEIMNGKKGVEIRADTEDLFEYRLQLADILTEQFRATADPAQKMALHAEMKNLVFQDKVALSDDFNPFESQTMICLALMLGKMGPTIEFHNLLDKMFKGCVEALTDESGWNDSQGFRLLAKVLAFVPEMREDAEVAYSLQFSAVDERLFKDDEAGEEGVADVEALKEEIAGGTAGVTKEEQKILATDIVVPIITDTLTSLAETKVHEDASSDADSASSAGETSPRDEDLNPNSEIYCNGCSDRFSNWNSKSIYGCIICTNCDLCHDCWVKRVELNNGGEWDDYKTYCGKDHAYIKGPMPGWKGVKNGMMKIGIPRVGGENGEEDTREIKFDGWIEGIQDRWAKSVRSFWTKENLVVDIIDVV